MREIKFRVWDLITKEMIYHDDSCDKELMICLGGGIFSDDGMNRNYRYTPMQYTGLKDKNGKEIYEGDITREAIGQRSDEISVVTFGYGNFHSHGRTVDNKIEVIGNIYSNPELLTK